MHVEEILGRIETNIRRFVKIFGLANSIPAAAFELGFHKTAGIGFSILTTLLINLPF